MSNHVHTVLHINAEQVNSWTDHEVLERWHSLFAGELLAHRYLAGRITMGGIFVSIDHFNFF